MVLRNEFTDEQERLQFIEKAAESTDRMIALVNDLLEVDHMQSGKGQFAFQAIDINTVIQAVLTELKPMVTKRKLTINATIDTKAIVRGDAEKLRSVFQNLIENAIKYTMPSGSITLVAKPDGPNIWITIQDTGIGISTEEQSQLFSKFFRAKNALKIDTTGSGLGLFIAKQVVERHGGKIWCESVLGTGTTFFIVLPRAQTS
jgi:signal transduction histidine kinase